MKKSDKMRQLLNGQTVKKNLTVEKKAEIVVEKAKEVQKEEKTNLIDKIKKRIVKKKD